MFNHEKFAAYHLAFPYWEQALRLIEQKPFRKFKHQRAAKTSSSKYFAEYRGGLGRNKNDDRKRFYAIARGSALECAAISDLIARLEPGLKAETDRTNIHSSLHSEHSFGCYS